MRTGFELQGRTTDVRGLVASAKQPSTEGPLRDSLCGTWVREATYDPEEIGRSSPKFAISPISSVAVLPAMSLAMPSELPDPRTIPWSRHATAPSRTAAAMQGTGPFSLARSISCRVASRSPAGEVCRDVTLYEKHTDQIMYGCWIVILPEEV